MWVSSFRYAMLNPSILAQYRSFQFERLTDNDRVLASAVIHSLIDWSVCVLHLCAISAGSLAASGRRGSTSDQKKILPARLDATNCASLQGAGLVAEKRQQNLKSSRVADNRTGRRKRANQIRMMRPH